MRQDNVNTHSLNTIQKSLSDFFGHVPGLAIHNVRDTPQNSQRTYQPDLMLDVTLSPDGETDTTNRSVSRLWRLVVESVRHTSPSLLEVALAMLTQYVDTANQAPTRASSVTFVPLLFAPYLSPGALGRCTEAGVNCLDAAGNGRIVLGTRTYIERIGQSDTTTRQNEIVQLFVPKSERVLRVLLNAAGALHRTWRIQPLAAEARVSVGQVARVKGALHERGFITDDSTVRRQGGFHLIRPEELLQEWAAAVRQKNYRTGVDHTYNAVDSVLELKRMLGRNVPSRQDTVALSGLLAAERYAPYVVSPLFTAYIVEKDEVSLARMEEALDLQSVDSGINVVLTVPRDEGVMYLPEDIETEFAGASDTLQAVSPIQTYLDMQRLGGRAEQGAQYLLETYLRPRWQRKTLIGTNA